MKTIQYLILSLFVIGVLLSPAQAATESSWYTTKYNKVRLIAKSTAVDQDGNVTLGVEFNLNPGWHIYWRSPGDAGLPPEFNFSKSDNLESVNVEWPSPLRFTFEEVTTVGYKDYVIFPVRVSAKNKTKDLTAVLNLNYLVCKDICLPQKAELKLSLPAGSAKPSSYVNAIEKFEKRVPRKELSQTLNVKGVYVVDANTLSVHVEPAELDDDATIYLELPAEVSAGVPQLQPAFPGTSVFNIALGDTGKKGLVGRDVTVTVINGKEAIESKHKIELGSQNSILFQDDLPPFVVMLGFAFLGGLILNLMPCVLPILSLKVLKVVNHAGESQTYIRRGFLYVCYGILASFLVLALVAIILRESGLAIGWGIQFQQPGFLIFLITILLAFSGSLWGLFEIHLPQSLMDRFHRLGQTRDHKIENFLTGAFATLLATPCTAPFLGAAVGFALAASAPVILAIFMSIAVGFALPYLVVALKPSWVALIPKPGKWMVYIRQALSLLLLASAIWLVTVLSDQMGMAETLVVCAILAAGVAVASVLELVGEKNKKWVRAAFIPLLLALYFVPPFVNHDSIMQEQKTYWQVFSPAAVEHNKRQGKVVFVDITADWCLTCKVNKAVALNRKEVFMWMMNNDVVALRGDWTNPDEVISKYLADHKRAGIPFNIVYGPHAPQGIILPELLTPKRVIDALKQAQ